MDDGHVGSAIEEPGDGRGVAAVPLHPQVQGPQPAQDEKAVERAGNAPHGVLQEPEPLGDRRVGAQRGHGHDHRRRVL